MDVLVRRKVVFAFRFVPSISDVFLTPYSDWIIRFLAETLCVEDPVACADVVFMLCGTDRSNLNNTRLYLYMEHTPGGTSVRNMMHWAQAVETGKFRMFDYGSVAGEKPPTDIVTIKNNLFF